jgi:hypothetical protein
MILYNITYNIDREVDPEWIDWLKNFYIPRVKATGFFNYYKVYRLLQTSDEGGINYSVQFFAESLTQLEQFLQKDAPDLTKELQIRFMHRHVAFMTVLQDTGL